MKKLISALLLGLVALILTLALTFAVTEEGIIAFYSQGVPTLYLGMSPTDSGTDYYQVIVPDLSRNYDKVDIWPYLTKPQLTIVINGHTPIGDYQLGTHPGARP